MPQKRKSAQARIASGGFYRPSRHGPLDPRGTIVLPPLDPTPPPQLDLYGRDVWERVYPVVAELGTVTEGDRDVFTLFCDAAGTFNRACDELNRGGWFRAKRTKGAGAFDADAEEFTRRPSVWYSVKRNAVADMTRAAALLGLTPVDRSRVGRASDPAPPAATGRPKTHLDFLKGPLRPPDGAG